MKDYIFRKRNTSLFYNVPGTNPIQKNISFFNEDLLQIELVDHWDVFTPSVSNLNNTYILYVNHFLCMHVLQ